ncbi:hypothetical protein R3P38DRAFT_3254484 [Favolaschia claudopus]|uniref:Uncharacterized protein n=1 Tax=Favolaschia claudopus TaxID=2862362 RepID=A0AAW0DQJ9_9AGAR
MGRDARQQCAHACPTSLPLTDPEQPAAVIIFAFTASCDLSIATAQVWLFHRHRRLKRGKFPFTLGRRRRQSTNANTDTGAVTRIDVGPADKSRINTVEPPPTSSITVEFHITHSRGNP